MIYKIYNDKNSKITVILIHGAYHGMWCWEKNFIPYFLKKKYAIISIDYIKETKTVGEIIIGLNDIIEKREGELYLISHSLGTSIAERYIAQFSPKLNGVIFMTPGPVIKRIRRTFIINLHNLLRDKSRLYFSNRLENCEMEKYIGKLRRETLEIESLIVRRNIPKRYEWKYRTLILGSQNDQCMPLSIIFEAGMFFNAKVIIYKELCHDMMLDPAWELVARDIVEFIQMRSK